MDPAGERFRQPRLDPLEGDIGPPDPMAGGLGGMGERTDRPREATLERDREERESTPLSDPLPDDPF